LGELAATLNTMGEDIRQMLDAKRALLLAISHELRSPITRARLNTELLPETPDVAPQRDALLRDLQEMAHLITDLLESERLAGRHAALQREPVALPALVREVLAELQVRHPRAASVRLHADPALPTLALDAARLRLLLRNLLDNALRHSADAPLPPEVHLAVAGQGISLTVRDHGPGVPDADVPRLAEPFFRPDAARTRAQGGVGLGLYLCKLVALAHGGTFAVRNAGPGLAVTVCLKSPALG
jgi:signal transduction histidine kinase